MCSLSSTVCVDVSSNLSIIVLFVTLMVFGLNVVVPSEFVIVNPPEIVDTSVSVNPTKVSLVVMVI